MHGLEQEWEKKIQFIHVNFRSPQGKELGQCYEITHLPALVLLDGAGQVRKKLGMGLHLRAEAESAIGSLVEN